MTTIQKLARTAAENRVNNLHPFTKEEFTGCFDEPAVSSICGFAEDILEVWFEEHDENSTPSLNQLENIAYELI